MSQVFYTLALLACPVGMGLMMFMMGRGQNKEPGRTQEPANPAGRQQIDALRAEIDALKAERAEGTPKQWRP